MPYHPSERVTVRVRLLDDPSLWAWEIRNDAEGGVVEDSWTTHWAAYRSREDAEHAAWHRVSELPAFAA